MAELLSEYKSNEVRADARFKGHIVATSGVVREVGKDVTGKAFVGVGNHKLTGPDAETERPRVQCFVIDADLPKVTKLNTGDLVAVRGQVDGLMTNVMLADCEIKTRADSTGERRP